jgi:hypothetical protein
MSPVLLEVRGLTLFGNDFINRAEYFAQRGPRSDAQMDEKS